MKALRNNINNKQYHCFWTVNEYIVNKTKPYSVGAGPRVSNQIIVYIDTNFSVILNYAPIVEVILQFYDAINVTI